MAGPTVLSHEARGGSNRGLPRIGALALVLLVLAGCDRRPREELVDGASLASLAAGSRFWHRTCEIAVGSEAAEPILIDGWSTPEPGGSWRWATGSASEIRIDALGGEALRLGFEVWAFRGTTSEGPQRIEVFLGDLPLGSVEVGPEPAAHTVEIPEGRLVAGHNRLVFRYARIAPAPAGDPRLLAVAWRRLWTETPGESSPHCVSDVGRFDQETLRLPFESGVELFFEAPGEHWLLIDSVELERTRESSSDASESPVSSPSGRQALTAVAERAGEGVRVEGGMTLGERGFRLRLPDGDGPVRVALVAGGAPGGTELVVAGARLAHPERPAAATEARAQRGPKQEVPAQAQERHAHPEDGPPARRRPNVLIYLVDTLRADHLGCYGYDRPTSPRIDAFAREGVLFERATAQSSWTRPAVATVLTGLDPRVHGVHRRGDRLAEEVVTLPERLQSMGYETAAVVTNGNVTAPFGFRQGFETFTYLPERASRGRYRLSRRVTEIAGAWLEQRIERGDERPFFLYLHTTDPHAPYAPSPGWRRRFLSSEPRPRLGSLRSLRELELGVVESTEEEVEQLVGLYDAEIAFNDHWFGVLLDRLDALGLTRDTLVVFLADHGEEFGEHGGWQHGRTLYQEQLHVPLVVRLPGGALAGSRRRELVQQTDVVPTVLELVGAPPADGLQGRSLLRLAEWAEVESEVSERPAFAILDLDGNRAEALLSGDHKLVSRSEATVGRPRGFDLFDLSLDPDERVDRSASERVRLGFLEALLRSRRVLWPIGSPAEQAVIDEELAEELRALGYVH